MTHHDVHKSRGWLRALGANPPYALDEQGLDPRTLEWGFLYKTITLQD